MEDLALVLDLLTTEGIEKPENVVTNRIIESFELERIFKGHLVQVLRNETGTSTARSGCPDPEPCPAKSCMFPGTEIQHISGALVPVPHHPYCLCPI